MQPARPKLASEITAVIRASRGVMMSVWLFSGLINILMLTGSLFMLQVYDRVLTSGSIPTLVALAGITAALYAFYGLLDYIRARIMVRIGLRVEERLRDRTFDAMTTHALRKTPGVGSSPITDLATIRQFLGGAGPFAFLDMPWVPIYVLVIALVHWMLGVAALVSALVVFSLAAWTEFSTRKAVSESNAASIKAQLAAEEVRRNAEAMQALGMRKVLRDRWVATQQRATVLQTMAADAGGGLGAVSRVFRLLVQSGMLALGAYLAVKHEITPGSMIACSIITGRALAPVEQAVATWQQFLGCRRAISRLEQVLASVPPTTVSMQLPRAIGRISADAVTVKVSNTDKLLLQGVTFEVGPGEGLGVIGPSGAGKSTLARALVGIVQPVGGKVRLDGATFDQRDPDENGRLIGYVPQDVQLFDGSAADNISRFDPNRNPDEVVAAAKLANIHELIMRLPQGYDTPLGEQAARLSAGQRQRFALARALYGDPVVLVLDEPNSNLDAEGEAALDRAIRSALQRGAAVIVVAHRPSALAVLHKVLVLNEGKVAAYGPRDEILRKLAPPRAQAQAAPLAVASGTAAPTQVN